MSPRAQLVKIITGPNQLTYCVLMEIKSTLSGSIVLSSQIVINIIIIKFISGSPYHSMYIKTQK